jgi:hypothetical protein
MKVTGFWKDGDYDIVPHEVAPAQDGKDARLVLGMDDSFFAGRDRGPEHSDTFILEQ